MGGSAHRASDHERSIGRRCCPISALVRASRSSRRSSLPSPSPSPSSTPPRSRQHRSARPSPEDTSASSGPPSGRAVPIQQLRFRNASGAVSPSLTGLPFGPNIRLELYPHVNASGTYDPFTAAAGGAYVSLRGPDVGDIGLPTAANGAVRPIGAVIAHDGVAGGRMHIAASQYDNLRATSGGQGARCVRLLNGHGGRTASGSFEVVTSSTSPIRRRVSGCSGSWTSVTRCQRSTWMPCASGSLCATTTQAPSARSPAGSIPCRRRESSTPGCPLASRTGPCAKVTDACSPSPTVRGAPTNS